MHESHLHAEQNAVFANMGFGTSSQSDWVRIVAIVLIVALVVGAVGGLILLTIR